MPLPIELLSRASDRARELNLPYAGAVTPAEAQAMREADPSVRIIDVRTRAELEWVGRVPGAVEIEWNTWPGGSRNPDFLKQLEAQVPKDVPVLFLCRSGGRSNSAAATAAQAGYAQSYNILEGFEGDRDAAGRRNTVGGWRKAGLPWSQG